MPVLPIDSGRYGSKEIRDIFDEVSRVAYQLEFESAVAQSQAELGIIDTKVAKEISDQANLDVISLERIKELETISDHDTAAVIEALSEKCSESSKPWIHFGLTSNDVVDTSTSMQLRDALFVIEPKILKLAKILSELANRHRKLPSVGRTHGQHASIIAFGLKFSVWAEELALHIERIEDGKNRFLCCKTLGVVGTGSLMGDMALDVQSSVARKLKLYPVRSATQIVSRERLAEALFLFALIGSTLEKMAVEVRNLQRTEISEVAEFFKKGQIGSSAVPVKKNPIKSERIASLSKMIRSMINVAMENIPLWHERDLSNSANERFIIPMTVILLDEMLNISINVMANLRINTERISSNLEITKGQIYSEFVLETLVRKNMPRFDAYRMVQKIAFEALDSGIHFKECLKKNESISGIIDEKELDEIFKPENHLSSSEKIIDNVIEHVVQCEKKYF